MITDSVDGRYVVSSRMKFVFLKWIFTIQWLYSDMGDICSATLLLGS